MTTYHVTLVRKDEPSESLRVDEDETVVEAARSQGVIIPVGCRDGGCGTCAGLILSAADITPSDDPEAVFEYRQSPGALQPEHRQQGFVLLCIAEPRTDCRLAVGAATWSNRSASPWI